MCAYHFEVHYGINKHAAYKSGRVINKYGALVQYTTYGGTPHYMIKTKQQNIFANYWYTAILT